MGIDVPLHPHPILPFHILSSPTLVYPLFHLLEIQAATHPCSGKHPTMGESLAFVIYLNQNTRIPVPGLKSVGMGSCRGNEGVSFGLWGFGREIWRSYHGLWSLEVGVRALGLGKSFLIFSILSEVSLLHAPQVGADYIQSSTASPAYSPSS